MQMERRAFETYFKDSGSKRRGAGDFPVCEGGAQQHCRPVRDLPDCGQRNRAEHLVPCGFGLRDHGAGVYYGNRPVYGCGGRQGGGILFSQALESNAFVLGGMEYGGFCADARHYAVF